VEFLKLVDVSAVHFKFFLLQWHSRSFFSFMAFQILQVPAFCATRTPTCFCQELPKSSDAAAIVRSRVRRKGFVWKTPARTAAVTFGLRSIFRSELSLVFRAEDNRPGGLRNIQCCKFYLQMFSTPFFFQRNRFSCKISFLQSTRAAFLSRTSLLGKRNSLPVTAPLRSHSSAGHYTGTNVRTHNPDLKE